MDEVEYPEQPIPEYQAPEGYALTTTRPPDEGLDIASVMLGLFDLKPQTPDDYKFIAMQVGQGLERLAIQHNYLKTLCWDVAWRINTHEIWKFDENRPANPKEFWMNHGWSEKDYASMQLGIVFHSTVKPVLEQYGGYTPEEIQQIASEASPQKVAALATHSTKITRQIKNAKKGASIDPAKVQEQVRTLVGQVQTLTDSDFAANRAAAQGSPDKHPVFINLKLVRNNHGEVYYEISGKFTQEDVLAWTQHLMYERYYYEGDRCTPDQLYTAINQVTDETYLPGPTVAGYVSPVSQPAFVVDDDYEDLVA